MAPIISRNTETVTFSLPPACKRRRENVPGGRLDRHVVAVENCTTRCLP